MTKAAKFTIESPPTIQLTTTSSIRAPISSARRDPVPVPSSVAGLGTSPRRVANIVVNLSASTEDGGTLRQLIESGVRVFRFNGRPAERERVLKAIYAIRSISTELGSPMALLFDACPSDIAANADPANWLFGIECGADWFAVAPGTAPSELQAARRFLTDQKRASIGILAKIETGASPQVGADLLQNADGVIAKITAHDDRASEHLDRIRRVVAPFRIAGKAILLAIDKMPPAMGLPALPVNPDAWLVEKNDAPIGAAQTFNLFAHGPQLSAHDDQTAADISLHSQRDKLIASAVKHADESNADGIVLFTRSGRSATLCAALRPRRARIFAFSPDSRLVRRLTLFARIDPLVLSFTNQSARTVRAAEKQLLDKRLLTPGTKLVVITESVEEEQRLSALQERALGQT